MSNEADRIQVQDVMLKYAAGIDDGDFELYRSCFVDEVEIVGMDKQPIHGIEAWMVFVKQALGVFQAALQVEHALGLAG